MVKHESKLGDTSYWLQVESLEARVKIQKCEYKPASYEFKSIS